MVGSLVSASSVTWACLLVALTVTAVGCCSFAYLPVAGAGGGFG